MKQVRHYSLLTILMVIGSCSAIERFCTNNKRCFFQHGNKNLYYGIDFTKAKLIDDVAANEGDIVERQYAGINQLTINEPDKFDLKAAFGRTIEHDITTAVERNEKVKLIISEITLLQRISTASMNRTWRIL